MNQRKNMQLKQFKWILLGCVPLFFFLRGIHLVLTGGGWIATTDQPFHWVLLFLEIFIAAFAVCGCFFLWYQELYILNKKILSRTILIKAITIAVIFVFVIHFIRVGFWIQNSIS